MKGKIEREQPETHPSYGAIGICRVTCGGGVSLFQSSIKHSNVIRLRIYHATKRRRYHEDTHMAEKPIIEVDMTPVQFSEMITSAGIGNGIPCTIRRLNGDQIPEPKFDSKREKFVAEFQEHTDRVAERFDELIDEMAEMFEKVSVGKKERQGLLSKLKLLKQSVECDTPFIADQFNEQMERTVEEAKGEVEGFIVDLVQKTGLDGLRANQISLE